MIMRTIIKILDKITKIVLTNTIAFVIINTTKNKSN